MQFVLWCESIKLINVYSKSNMTGGEGIYMCENVHKHACVVLSYSHE